MKRNLLFIASMLISILSFSQVNLTGYNLIANYPLTADGKEANGLYANMALNGVVVFKNGGIYSNGIYSGANYCYIVTPTLDSMKLNDFIVTLDFKIDSLPAGWDPVFSIGQLWRLLGVGLYKQDSTLFLIKNGTYLTTNRSQFKYKLNTWYTLALKHKADFSTLYVNDKSEITHTGVLDTGPDVNNRTHRQISNAHTGLGLTYRGYWRNLKVYAPSLTQNMSDNSYNQEIDVFPNPSRGRISIDLTSVSRGNRIFISVSDLKGNIIISQNIIPTQNVFCLDKILSQGCYFVTIKTPDLNVTQKIIVLK